jgi:hypothetical protein
MKNEIRDISRPFLIFGIICGILACLPGLIVGASIGIRKSATETAWRKRVREPQAELAMELGIKVNDYPYPWDFPIGYFTTVIKSGMTYEEVHLIVRGYEQVFSCYESEEIYDYFGTTKEDRLRFEINYDKAGKYVYVTEENQAEAINIPIFNDCTEGLLGR